MALRLLLGVLLVAVFFHVLPAAAADRAFPSVVDPSKRFMFYKPDPEWLALLCAHARGE
jgi:hypothetical protein